MGTKGGEEVRRPAGGEGPGHAALGAEGPEGGQAFRKQPGVVQPAREVGASSGPLCRGLARLRCELRLPSFRPPGLDQKAGKASEVADISGRHRERTHERGGAYLDILDTDRLARGRELGQQVAGPDRFCFSEGQNPDAAQHLVRDPFPQRLASGATPRPVAKLAHAHGVQATWGRALDLSSQQTVHISGRVSEPA